LTQNILDTYKQKITGLELIPDGGGCFELSLNGELTYSKLNTGQFPDEDEIVAMIGKRL